MLTKPKNTKGKSFTTFTDNMRIKYKQKHSGTEEEEEADDSKRMKLTTELETVTELYNGVKQRLAVFDNNDVEAIICPEYQLLEGKTPDTYPRFPVGKTNKTVEESKNVEPKDNEDTNTNEEKLSPDALDANQGVRYFYNTYVGQRLNRDGDDTNNDEGNMNAESTRLIITVPTIQCEIFLQYICTKYLEQATPTAVF